MPAYEARRTTTLNFKYINESRKRGINEMPYYELSSHLFYSPVHTREILCFVIEDVKHIIP